MGLLLGMHLFIKVVCTAGLGDFDPTGMVEAGGAEEGHFNQSQTSF